MAKKLFFIIASIFIITLMRISIADSISSGQKIYNDVSSSIFTIFSIVEDNKNKSALGSAVAIDSDLLATNCHVALSGNFLIVEINNKPYVGRLYYYNKMKDICIIELAGAKLHPVNIRPSSNVNIGEEVYAIGNPEGIEKTISRGIISNKESKNGMITHLQTDAAISHGSSGGGLFDKDSNLIGITTAMDPNGENIGFAIPTELILAVIKPDDYNHKDPNIEKSSANGQKATTASYNQSNNGLINIGYYGNDKIGLMKLNNKCFITITGRYRPDQPTSLAIWYPDTPNGMFIFSRIFDTENAIKFISGMSDDKTSYEQSKSFIFFDNKLLPLTIISIGGTKFPIYIFSRKDDLTKDLINLNDFLGQFYRYAQNKGMTTITFGLDGFTEALAAYNQYCAVQEQ